MQAVFKKHQLVKFLRAPNQEYVEYHIENEEELGEIPITKGMKGRINLFLPNGQYHVEVLDEHGHVFAYALFSEDDLVAE